MGKYKSDKGKTENEYSRGACSTDSN